MPTPKNSKLLIGCRNVMHASSFQAVVGDAAYCTYPGDSPPGKTYKAVIVFPPAGRSDEEEERWATWVAYLRDRLSDPKRIITI